MRDDKEEIDGNIYSFGYPSTQKIFDDEPAPGSPVPDELHDKARRVMNELDCAESWEDLTRHDLTSLSGAKDNWYELDINDQYQIYFELNQDWKGSRSPCGRIPLGGLSMALNGKPEEEIEDLPERELEHPEELKNGNPDRSRGRPGP